MGRLTRDQAVARLLDGIRSDIEACGVVRELLERQFEAALRHRAAELSGLAEQLLPQLDSMEQRRQQRVQLVRALHGANAGMDQLLNGLPPAQRGSAGADWARLEALVRDCKQATARNGSLMADQYTVMQRVLHGEDQLYAPR
jgi:flagella synthesis protein FlgN